MSNEAVVPGVDAPVVETPEVVVEQPVLSPVESSAREQGWVPKEEWVANGGAEDDWKSAREFVRTGELYKSLHSQKRELKQTQAALSALQHHHQFVYDKAHKQAIADLKMERRAAIREGDDEYLDVVENKIEEANREYALSRQALVQAQQAAAQATQSGEFDAFVARNPWYLTDQELRDEADAIGFVYLNKPGSSKEGLVKHVEQKIKQKFPEKFGARKAAPSPTVTGDRTVRASKSDIQLDEMETQIMKSLVQSGTMTEAEYKAELKRAKGIK